MHFLHGFCLRVPYVFAEICSYINPVMDLEFMFAFYCHFESYIAFLGLSEVMA